MKTKFLIFFFLLIFIIVEVIYSRAFRVDQLPNGKVFRCLNCHQSIAGDGPLNPFGEEVSAKFLNQNGDVVWGPELAKLDSDGDGFTNGQELQDPEGKWKIGDKDPGNPDLVSLPGDPGSKPPLKSSSRYNNYFENIDNELLIQPNPVNGKQINFNLKLDKDEIANLQIISVLGFVVIDLPNILISSDNNSMPLIPLSKDSANFPDGIYFLRIEIRNRIFIKSFILSN